jgi:hypothetical protein
MVFDPTEAWSIDPENWVAVADFPSAVVTIVTAPGEDQFATFTA